MSDKMVTLATFSNPVEAELARGRLEAEGIPAFVMGEVGGQLFAGMSNLFGEVRLLVPEARARQALEVLEDVERLAEEPGEESTAITSASPRAESPTQVRAAAESPVTERPPSADAPDEETSEPAPEFVSDDDEDEREERPLTFTADDIAARSARAAIFGFLICPGPLHLYALWLLLSLLTVEGHLSPSGRRKAVAAFALAIGPALIAAALAGLFVLALVLSLLR